MQSKDAVSIATAYATEKGLQVDLYATSTDETRTVWYVHFTRENKQHKPGPGDFFTVVVEKNTETATTVIPGK